VEAAVVLEFEVTENERATVEKENDAQGRRDVARVVHPHGNRQTRVDDDIVVNVDPWGWWFSMGQGLDHEGGAARARTRDVVEVGGARTSEKWE
jgi:hypothetical protein